ncbi:hypothetical protein [Bacteroides zoogleoformans]|uniref:hypothetical protein n=1 Tax=Bacteroides zoogleoformans TaxID=28119 RepID=UPI00248DCB0C|nr:hypothetical protein [Bacteroides zoogleoformans]
MKHLNFLMIAFTLLLGVSLTSCLSSDNESTFDGYGYVRAKQYLGSSWFEDLGGNKYFPTASSLATVKANSGFDITQSDLVFIQYKNVETKTRKETETTTNRTIQLVGAMAIDSYRAQTAETEADMLLGDAPIVTLTPTAQYSETYKPFIYGSEMVVLPIHWKMENKKEALEQHSFQLVYVKDMQKNASELVLYLQHNKGTDAKTEADLLRYKAYDIKSIMSAIKSNTGKYPGKIIIKAKVAADGKTMPETYTDFEIDSSDLNKLK